MLGGERRFVHLRVPPPTEETSYIFASRSLVVRLRASLHLAHWYKRLLQVTPRRILCVCIYTYYI